MEARLDIFISYASEDRSFVRGLASVLHERGLDVWFDEQQLVVGRSLREQIDSGLRRSRFGIVVISQSFFAKSWPRIELDGLLAVNQGYDHVLPIWLDVDHSFVASRSPTLAGRLAVVARTVDPDYAHVADAIQRAVSRQAQVAGESLAPISVLADVPQDLEIGTLGLVFAAGFSAQNLVVRSQIVPCVRRGIRFPTDIWTDTENRPLWNRSDVPVPERRFAFESLGDRFLSTELFTVGFGGQDMRQVTHSNQPADNALSDDEQGWVFEWESPSAFWFSSMRDGWHQRIQGHDQ